MESLTPVVNYILEGEFPKEFTTGQRRKLIKQASTFLWLEGALYQKGKDLVCKRVPSTNEIPKILKGLHEEACGGHFSHELTLKKVLLAGYVWPSMHADVQHWCRSCHNCQVNGNKRLLYGPRQAVIANGPFEKWGIDAMGPLPRTANGKLYILVAIDYMTRWVEAQSVAKVNEKIVSKFVYTHICCKFGTPLEIVSDNGPGFRRGLLTEVCEVLKISHRHSTPYYPQSNGLVEKANGIIAGIIRKMVESKPKRWDNFLDGAIWAYKTTYRDATQFTPFHLVYGQEALQPIELNIPTIKLTGRQEQSNDEAWIDRLLNLVELEWKREAAYHCYEKKALQLKDKLNEGIKDKEIKEKSLVLRYNNALDNRFDAKFERRWEGPFIVKKAFTGGYYQLMDLNGKEHPRKVNGYRLKPYLSRILPAVFETKQVSKKTKKWVLELQEYEYTFILQDSTRASLANVLTYKVKEKKITPKAQGKLDFSPQGELEDAYTLLFDGAYRRQRNKVAGGFVILNEEKEVLKKGIQLHLVHSNNEAEYATLKAGLEECKSMGIRRLMVKGDALLIVRQVQGTWACKNSKLLQWLHEVKLLMKDFKAIQIQHISRQHNKETDNMANTQFEVMVGEIKFKEPLFQGQDTMEDILYFLETGECPKHLERVQRHCLVRKALSYQLIGEHLYHKGKDLVLRRVPLVKEIEKILMSCHDGVCGGHFAQEITSRKILQAGFVCPSLHRDVQHWCKACKACQQAGDRKLSYGPRFPIFAYGPFEKWGIDAIGPLPRTSTGKQYILTATDYMTRWAEVASVALITAVDVSKFVLDYICSRFGTPLEILSDRGPGFRADLLDALLENLSIKHVHSTPYYPQCNGLVEKTNGVLCKIITKHVKDRPQDWDKHLTAALWAYRTSFKVSTQFTPYHLVYGQEALLPIEVELGSLRVLARETTSSKEKLEQRILDLQRLELDREAATDYYITQANKKREHFNNKIKEKKLKEGMLVMRYDSRLDLSHSKKFLQRWEGPYVIFKKFKNGSYRLQDLSGKIHKYPINGWRLKEFFQRIQPIKEEKQVSLNA
ncbi:hypothetical protein L7F22_028521 [Adiantum nelumboides]|nr:hypothetical protein [Adiantum nelumboides]